MTTGEYFGADSVHGEANKELTPELVSKLGRCGSYALSQHEEEGKRPHVLVGRDTGIPGRMLGEALISGLSSVGIKAFQLGMISTPGAAYLTRSQKVSAGVMISASHDPAQGNGIKFFGADGSKLVDDQELKIETLLDTEIDELPRPSADGLGTVEGFSEGLLKHSQFLVQMINGDLSSLTIYVDAADGATSTSVSCLFADLETDFYTTGINLDGLSINGGVGFTHPERSAEMVVEEGTDAGLAFDGDGDRIIAVDELGNIVNGDKVMFTCVKHLAKKNHLKKDTIVTTMMSNLGFHKAVEGIGLEDIVTQVDDRYVVEEARKNDYDFGGEQSGHMIFLDLNTTGDGMLSGIQLLNIMKQTGKKLSKLAVEVTIYPQKSMNICISDKNGAMDVPVIKKVIEEAEAEMGLEGRILIRSSSTEPLLCVIVETPTDGKVSYYVGKITTVVKEEIGLD